MASPAAKTDPDDGEGFTEQRRRKRFNSSEEGGSRSAKIHIWSKEEEGALATNSPAIQSETASRPSGWMRMIRSVQAKMESNRSRPQCERRQAGPVSLHLLEFQGELKPIIKGTFKFRTTRNGIKVVTKDMADCWY
jgi:hypothetical protein